MNALAAEGAALLADLALKGTLLLAVAVAAAWMLRGASAAARHLALGIALAALLALPVLTVALPAWRVPVLPGRLAPPPVAASAPVMEAAPSAAVPEIAGARQASVDGRSGPAAAASTPARAPARRAGPVDRPVPLGSMFFVLWAVGAAAVLVRLGASLARVRRDGRAARPLEHGAAARALDAAVWRLGIDRPVRLLEGGPNSMPLTWGVLRPRVLLPSGTDAWPADRLRAVLTHELAHVRRRDCAWQLAAEAACALHWFNPLAWAAARRLRLESEHACDDHVLMAGSRGCDYAGHLLEVARTLRPPRHAALAGVAMARPSQLRTRLGAVLSPDRRRGPVPRAAAAAALLVAGALVAGVAAAAPAGGGAASAALVVPGTCSTSGRGQSEHDVVNGRDEWTVEWSNHAGCGGSARIRGVRFSADFTDVASVSRGGFLRLELRDGGARTAVEVRPSGDGVVKTIRAGGTSVPWDARADAWLAAAIAELMRHTDYATDARTAFLLAAGGPEALAAEVEHVTGSTRKRYAEALLSAAARMDAAPRRDALLALARTRNLDAEMQVALLNAAVGLGPDAELSRFLAGAAPHLSRDARVVQAYGLAAGRIGAGPLRDAALRAFERSWPLDQASAPAEPAAPAEPSGPADPASPADPAGPVDPAAASPSRGPAAVQDGLPADGLDQPEATTTLRYTSDTGEKQSVMTLLAKDVTLTRDRRRIDRVSADGWLILREETGGATRRVEVRAAADGTLRYSWGGDFSGVDREDWLREMVAFFARQTAPRLRW